MKYNILYYKWNEITFDDAYYTMIQLGHSVTVLRTTFSKYDYDEPFIETAKKAVVKNSINIIFSFNYFPDLSRVANEMEIRYVSWVYDSPHNTLYSNTLENECNTVNLFDYGLYEKFANQNIKTVRYMPLACNVERLEKQLQYAKNCQSTLYKHDITFLGNLYNDQYNFYSQIDYIPDYIRGYIDAATTAQSNIYGLDVISPIIDENICEELFKYVEIDMGPLYRECKKDIFVNMIQKNLTSTERCNLLSTLSNFYKVDHFANCNSNLPVNYRGYASYLSDMPNIFFESKINLNISLRSIMTGIPLRVVDILGAGGFCLSNYQAEFSEYFQNDVSIVWYDSYESLFEKVTYYLNNDCERESIAKRGHQIVKENFTYDLLLPKVLEY